MFGRNGNHFNSVHLEGTNTYFNQVYQRDSGIVSIKYVRILLLETISGQFVGINVNSLFLQVIDRADVIQAGHMVLVRMREENSIDIIEMLTQHLQPEIRSGVNHDPDPVDLYKYRAARSVVPGII